MLTHNKKLMHTHTTRLHISEPASHGLQTNYKINSNICYYHGRRSPEKSD